MLEAVDEQVQAAPIDDRFVSRSTTQAPRHARKPPQQRARVVSSAQPIGRDQGVPLRRWKSGRHVHASIVD
jgi:hypothetical protein